MENTKAELEKCPKRTRRPYQKIFSLAKDIGELNQLFQSTVFTIDLSRLSKSDLEDLLANWLKRKT